MGPGGHLFKRKVWESIITGSVPALEAVVWEIITAEVHSGRCCFRKALLLSLDGSDFANEGHRNELLQRFAGQSGAGDTDAQCFIGILLCFQGGSEADQLVMPAHGVKFLHAAAERHNNLATLLLALCFECGKGVEVSTDAAKQCYNMAATRGYQMAQIFLKELVRDTTYATQQQLQSLHSSLQNGPSHALVHPGLHASMQVQPGMHASMQANQQGRPNNLSPNLQFSQPGNQGQGPNFAGLGLIGLGENLPEGNRQLPPQTPLGQDGWEQHVAGAKTRLQTALQEQDPFALASAIQWAREVSGDTGKLTEDLQNAQRMLVELQVRSNLNIEGSQQGHPSRSASPAPSQHSNAAPPAEGGSPTLAGAIGEKTVGDNGAAGDKPNGSAVEAKANEKALQDNSSQPTAEQKGELFFQETGSVDVPLEALESDVEKPPSEVQPKELEAMLAGIESGDAETSAPPKGPVAFAVGLDKEQTPAVAIPKKLGSHGSIGDRRQLTGSVSESEPPMSTNALDLFSVIASTGSRSAPNSHRGTLDKLSVASLASLQPAKQKGGGGGSDGEDSKSDGAMKLSPTAAGPIARSASTRAPSPAPRPEDIRRTHSALGTRDGEGPPGFENLSLGGNRAGPSEGETAVASLESLISSPDAAAGKTISLADIQDALNSAEPEKREEYLRWLRQVLQQNPELANTLVNQQQQGPQAAQPTSQAEGSSAEGATNIPGDPNVSPEDAQRLIQAFGANAAGLEGPPLNDYIHNLRMLAAEDPGNEMVVMPPPQSIPGIEAILGAMQAQGATAEQQQQLIRAATLASRNQTNQMNQLRQQQLNLQGQPGFGAQGLPMGVGNDLGANRFPSIPHAAYGSQGLNNPLAGYNAGVQGRRFGQPLNATRGAFIPPGSQDIAHLLEINNANLNRGLPNGVLGNRAGLAPGLNPPVGPQARNLGPGASPPANYNHMWGMYGNKQGLEGLGGANPGAFRGNLGAQGLGKQQILPDLHRSLLTQGNFPSGNTGLNTGLNASMAGNQMPWNGDLLNQRLSNGGMQANPGNPNVRMTALGPQPVQGQPVHNLQQQPNGASNYSLFRNGSSAGNLSANNLGLNSQGGTSLGLNNPNINPGGLNLGTLGSGNLGTGNLGNLGSGNLGNLGSGSLGNLGSGNLGNLGNLGSGNLGRFGTNLQGAGSSQPGHNQGAGNLATSLSNASIATQNSIGGNKAQGQGLMSSSSQQALGESLWGSQPQSLQASQGMSSAFGAPSMGSNDSLHLLGQNNKDSAFSKPLSQAPSLGQSLNLGQSQADPVSQGEGPATLGLDSSASSGILAANTDANAHNRLRQQLQQQASAPMTSQGIFPQGTGSSNSLAGMPGWSSTESFQQMQAKASTPLYAGLAGSDSLSNAFRARPPRGPISGPFTSNPRPGNNYNTLGSIGSGASNNLGTGLTGDTLGNNYGGGNLGGLGYGNNLGSSGNLSGGLGTNLGTGLGGGLGGNLNNLSSGFSNGLNGGFPGGNINNQGSLGSLGLGRLPQNLLNQQQAHRQPQRGFPGQGF